MKRLLILPIGLLAAFAGGATRAVQDQCGPFTDMTPMFCPYVLEAYYTGITVGTSPTTFSPDLPITRGQAAVFVTRGLNQALARGSRRAALGQWWTTQNEQSLGVTNVGANTRLAACDGADVWVASSSDGSVARVRASDGRLLETWTGAINPTGVLVAMGRVFVTGHPLPPAAASTSAFASTLYMIDPSQPAGTMTIVASDLGVGTFGLTFDGAKIWTADFGTGLPNTGSISIVTPSSTLPWPVTTVSAGLSAPFGAAFDGANVWVTDSTAGTVVKLDKSGAVLQTVSVGGNPSLPVFDGANLWVPLLGSASVAVVQASTGELLMILTGNGLNNPRQAAFDGQRILVTNGSGSVSLWKAADLSPLGSFSTGPGTAPYGASSDGIVFWVTLSTTGQLARF